MRFFFMDATGLLYGSLSEEDPLYSLAFIRLLALCALSPRWGTVCMNSEGEGYSISNLAFLLGFINKKTGDVVQAIEECKNFLEYQVKKERIEIDEKGAITILNWDKYQTGAYARKRRERERKKTQNKTNQVIPNGLRFEVFMRDNFTCRYCGRMPPEAVLEIDHIIPRSKGGTNGIDNLVTCCRECNQGKRVKIMPQVKAVGIKRKFTYKEGSNASS